MVRSLLTLAALATSAVPNLDLVRVAEHTNQGFGDYSSAKLWQRDGNELIIRVPANQQAETLQSADLLGIAALSAGARSRLPFAVPHVLGQTRAKDTRAVVYEFVAGSGVELGAITADTSLVRSLAEAIAAIHGLPSSVIVEAGLSVRSAAEVRMELTRLVERAQRTGLLPEIIHRRWLALLADDALWQFSGTVINGGFAAESLLIDDAGELCGILNWSEFRVADPAIDFGWLCAAPQHTLHAVVSRYAQLRNLADPVALIRRAELYRECEIARWLLHGKDTHDDAIVADAAAMLSVLLDRVTIDGGDGLMPREDRGDLSLTQVHDVLDQVPKRVLSSSNGESVALTDDGLDSRYAVGEQDSAVYDSAELRRAAAASSLFEATGISPDSTAWQNPDEPTAEQVARWYDPSGDAVTGERAAERAD